MKLSTYKLAELISKSVQEELSDEEGLLLKEWLSESDQNKQLFDRLTSPNQVREGLEYFGKLDVDLQWKNAKRAKRLKKIKTIAPYFKYAATIVGVLFALFLFIPKKQSGPSSKDSFALVGKDIYPGEDKATLSFDNGVVFDLNSLKEGEIWQEEGIRIEKGEDGELVYTSLASEEDYVKQVLINTVSTPRGGQYRVSLPDGTQVWLNAASTLVFPSVFDPENRIVKLSGEAYFEVAKDKKKPFRVITQNEEVEVLGTHFNVNSYMEDEASFVTLIEGKVKVSSDSYGSEILNPGQQSVIREGGMQVTSVNLEEAIAWKNGEFMFLNESMKSVMRKLARWYDIDIVLSPELENISFWGTVSRFDEFEKVLKAIELTDESIRFKVEGRRVYIMK